MSNSCRWREALFQDWHRYSRGSPTWKTVPLLLIFNAGFFAVFLFRMSQALHARGWNLCGKLVRRFNLAVSSAELNPAAEVGAGLFLPHPYGVGIGGGCRIGRDVTVHQGVSIGAKTVEVTNQHRTTEYPRIGDGVILYPGGLVYGPVKVGNEAVILGNSVVSSDLAGSVTYGGVPAREIRANEVYSSQVLRFQVAKSHSDEDLEPQ